MSGSSKTNAGPTVREDGLCFKLNETLVGLAGSIGLKSARISSEFLVVWFLWESSV